MEKTNKRLKAYISCTQYDEKEARHIYDVLKNMGMDVFLDEEIFSGTFWNEERCEHLGNADVVVEINCPGSEYVSHTADVTREYVRMLNIPRIQIDSDEKHFEWNKDLGYGFRGTVFDEDIEAKLNHAVEKIDWNNHKVEDIYWTKEKLLKRDFGVRFYSKYGAKGKAFSLSYMKFLNLRTHEVFDSHYNRIENENGPMLLPDAKVFQALTWLFDDFLTLSKSEMQSYTESFEDQMFLNELTRRGCKPPEYLIRKYDRLRENMDNDDYPYMDEFEYIDSNY